MLMNRQLVPNFRELIPAVWRQAGELLASGQRLRLLGSTPTGHSLEARCHQAFKAAVPQLTADLHKGECGRIAVVGGSAEYTGAPYYAAISSLKVGADLSHVFCPPEAATVIKSYSPELIVHPLLTTETESEMLEWLSRMHCVVLGPGLGRKPETAALVAAIIHITQVKQIPIVIDADGLYFITAQPDLIMHNPLVILTPNVVEFARLYKAVIGDRAETTSEEAAVEELAGKLGNVTIVHKGAVDVISAGADPLLCTYPGSPRRCGGQGDVLAGALGTFAYWVQRYYLDAVDDMPVSNPNLLAAYAAALLTKTCSAAAYTRCGRSMTTVDLIDQLGPCLSYVL